jgi:hypothetical protein
MNRVGRRILLVVIVGVGLTGLSLYQNRATRYREIDIVGTVRHVDAGDRTAIIEFRSPRNGKLVEMKGSVPADCRITINGNAAQLGDLAAGDNGRITARWDSKSKTATPLGVAIERPLSAKAEKVVDSASSG